MLQRFLKVFLFLILINFQYSFVYANDETYKDGKEWKELNFGLIEAAKEGKLEKVKELLGRGAIVKTKNRFGNTALHYAARNNHIKILKVLIKAGSLHDLPSLANKTPFLEALVSGNEEIANILLKLGVNVKIEDNDSMTAVTAAAYNGLHTICEKIIKRN